MLIVHSSQIIIIVYVCLRDTTCAASRHVIMDYCKLSTIDVNNNNTPHLFILCTLSISNISWASNKCKRISKIHVIVSVQHQQSTSRQTHAKRITIQNKTFSFRLFCHKFQHIRLWRIHSALWMLLLITCRSKPQYKRNKRELQFKLRYLLHTFVKLCSGTVF